MRVVFLTHNYPRFPGDVAGLFLHPLATALAKRGHDVRVVAPSDRGAGGSDLLDGIPVTRVRYAVPDRERYAYTGHMADMLQTPGGWMALTSLLRSLRRGAREALAGPADAVLHAHWWFPAGLAAPPGPTVVTLHGTDARLLARPGATWLARRALRKGRVVTAVSNPVADLTAQATGRPLDSIPVQPMPLAAVGHRSAGGGGLVVVGRLTAQKRTQLAIEAHRLLAERRPGLALTVVGEGPERARLEGLVAERGTGASVRFAGPLPPEGVATILATADLMLAPAVGEGLGLAAVEALTAGVPVVACQDGGGLRDVMADVGAGLVVEATPVAIAEAANTLLTAPESGERAFLAGQRWRDRLAPERVATFFEERYLEALRDR